MVICTGFHLVVCVGQFVNLDRRKLNGFEVNGSVLEFFLSTKFLGLFGMIMMLTLMRKNGRYNVFSCVRLYSNLRNLLCDT